jgi:V8-like Glu-specific endopeptidase
MNKSVAVALCIIVASFCFVLAEENNVRQRSISSQEMEDSSNYWTPEKMRNAISLDLFDDNGKILQIAGATVPSENSPSSKRANSEGTVSDYNIVPHNRVGKIFFSRGELNFVCSGSIVHNNVILTAAHCVYGQPGTEDAGFSTNLVFAPGYNNGVHKTYGIWNAQKITVNGNWANTKGGYCFDYTFTVIAKKNGKTLASAVGGYLDIDFTTNPTAQEWTSFGYPANYANGETMRFSKSNLAHDNGCTRAIYSTSTGGTSGGPWILSSNGKVNGVNSYGLVGVADKLYSPKFDVNTQNEFNAAVASSP